MTSVQLQADKRFRRARAQPLRRRSFGVSGRTVRLLLACIVIAAAVHQGPGFLSRSDLLRVEHVTIKGNRYLSRGEVLALLGRLHGENILEIDLEAHRELLLTSGWVQNATLRRLLPATIEVAVAEHEPVGLVRLATQLYLIDATGTVIDEYRPQFAHLRLPVIDGMQMRNTRGSAVDRARAQLVAHLMGALAARPDLSRLVSQIDVTDASNAVVLLSDDSTLLHLGEEQFVERLDRYLDLAQALRASVPDIDYVDLRYEKRVYVRPASDGYTE